MEKSLCFSHDENVRKIIDLAKAGSTNDLAFEYAAQEPGVPLVVVADEQSSGRGRRGRSWVSGKGKGLYMSMAFFPELPLAALGRLSLAAGWAVQQLLEQRYGLPALVKWPNDIIVNHKKICGILMENRELNEAERCFVVGIGINTNWESADCVGDFRRDPTAMNLECGKRIEHAPLLKQVVESLVRFFDFAASEQWEQVIVDGSFPLYGRGRPIYIVNGDDERTGVEGRILGIDPEAGLVVVKDTNEKIVVRSGEVCFADRD